MFKRTIVLVAVLALLVTACGDDEATTLTVYSGRSQDIVEPLFAAFTAQSGIKVEVRYAGSTDLAATLREEQANSPADVFFAQDPASLGAVAEAGLFSILPAELLAMVPSTYSDRDGRWIGVSGRARVVVYDSTLVSQTDLPSDVFGFADPAWSGRIGIAPGNGSFLAFVASMILIEGEDITRTWLQGIANNSPERFTSNSSIVAAVDGGQIPVGLVNHYYLLRLQAAEGETAAANHFLASGGPGSLVMPAGVGVLATTEHNAEAEQFVRFLLSSQAQTFFATETFEYPLVKGFPSVAGLPPIGTLKAPDLDLSALAIALDRATELVAEAGLL